MWFHWVCLVEAAEAAAAEAAAAAVDNEVELATAITRYNEVEALARRADAAAAEREGLDDDDRDAPCS